VRQRGAWDRRLARAARFRALDESTLPVWPRMLLPFRVQYWALGAALLVGGCMARSPVAEPAEQPYPRALQVAVHVPARLDTASLLLYLPPAATAGEPVPTVLYLHGGSQRGSDLEMLKGYGPPRLLARGHELPFILIAPQLPTGEIWSDAEGLIALIDELARQYPIDPDRLYVTGISMGGRGAWYLAYRYPDRFAAVAPVAAFQPISHWASSGRLGRVPVRAYHGDEDPLAPFADAVRMHEGLNAASGLSELVRLSGRDHFIADIMEDLSLYEWLLQHRRHGGESR
jgi:predicted peptidase